MSIEIDFPFHPVEKFVFKVGQEDKKPKTEVARLKEFDESQVVLVSN